MKRLLLILSCVIFFGPLSAKKLVAYFDYKTFYSPGDGGILETYLNFDGTSVFYETVDTGTSQAKVEVTIVIKKGGHEIIDFRKKEITSPVIRDLEYINFMDQTRFLLPDGDYNVVISLKDLNNVDQESFEFTKSITINTPKSKPFFSDIELIAAYRPAKEDSPMAKSGYDLLPYFSNFYSSEFSELLFYIEVYNLEKKVGNGKPILLTYSIEDPSSGTVVGNLRKFSRLDAAPVISHLGIFNIADLYSGNYDLVIEVRDSDNSLIKKTKSKIIRQKTDLNISYNEEYINETFVGEIESKEDLIDKINSIRPICGPSELSVLDHSENLDIIHMKSFFYSFWLSRNADNPKLAWNNYEKRVAIATQKYGTRLVKGYNTDRGRIFLKYGDPSSVYIERMPEFVHPFEIWHYKEIDGKFIFYSPESLQETYYLLHSNIIQESHNPNWLAELYRVTNAKKTQSDTDQLQNNNRIKELFNNPR